MFYQSNYLLLGLFCLLFETKLGDCIFSHTFSVGLPGIFKSMARGKGMIDRKATMFQTGNKFGCKQKSEESGETAGKASSYCTRDLHLKDTTG